MLASLHFTSLVLCRSKIFVAAGLLLFRAIIDILYAKYVYETFGYAGYALDINPTRIVFSYIVFTAVVVAMPLGRRTSKSFFLFVIVLLLLLPATSYYAMSGQSPEALALTLLATGVVWLFLATVPSIIVPKLAISNQRELILVATAIGLGYFLIYLYDPERSLLAGFNLTEIYEMRQESKETVSGLRAYLLGNLCKALAPASIATLLMLGKRFAAVLLGGGLLLIMGALGYKEIALYAMLPFMFYCAHKLNISFQNALLAGLITLSIIATIWWRASGQHYPLALLVHRGMVVNAQNNVEYIDFFKENTHTIWGNSFLRGVVEYEYPRKIPEIIGSDRYGVGQYGFSNVGLVGSGYMHLGGLGVCIYAMLVAVYACFVNCVSRLNVLSVSLIFIATVQFVSADLPSALLTHGGLLVALLLYTLALNDGHADPKARGVYRSAA